jgi:hypothetical protein
LHTEFHQERHAHNLRFINIVAINLKRTFDATAISTNGAYNGTLDGISVNGAYSAAQNLINSVTGACTWNAILR